jgi:hypothetical protein
VRHALSLIYAGAFSFITISLHCGILQSRLESAPNSSMIPVNAAAQSPEKTRSVA